MCLCTKCIFIIWLSESEQSRNLLRSSCPNREGSKKSVGFYGDISAKSNSSHFANAVVSPLTVCLHQAITEVFTVWDVKIVKTGRLVGDKRNLAIRNFAAINLSFDWALSSCHNIKTTSQVLFENVSLFLFTVSYEWTDWFSILSGSNTTTTLTVCPYRC